MRNRILPLLFVLCLLLCACQKQPTAEDLSEPYAQSGIASENTQAAEASSVTDVLVPSAADAQPTQAGSSVLTNSAVPSAAEYGNASQNPQESPNAGGGKANGNQDAAVPKQSTVSLTVDCKNAVDYGILGNPNFADVLPQDGIILSDGNVPFTEGESVMAVLKRALKAQKTVCQITSGGYVKSIAGLAEKDCGETSGWLYRVNGKMPNISCKYYKLQAGDRVEFIYTCRMGDVGET